MNPNEGCRLTHDEITGEYTFKWWGRAGHTYFIQCSDDLIHWSYVPVIESGAAAVTEYGFSSTAGRFFLRLRHTDAATGGNPDTADFDGDHVSNMAELDQHTDPLLKADTDGDQMPDDWEKLFSFDPASAADGLLDTDGDGLTNRAEWLASSDPRNADTDGDGFQDGYEVQKGADPALAASSPLTLVQAQRTALTAAVQAYLAARAANADAETRKTLWDAIQQLSTFLAAELQELTQNTESAEVLGQILQTTEDIAGDVNPAESAPSTAVIQWRWMDSSCSAVRWESSETTWSWSAAGWTTDSSRFISSGIMDADGYWSESDGDTGTNHSLAEALNRTPNFSGQAEGWHDTSARTFTAAAILETGTGSTSGGAPTWTGEFPGQLATTTKIDYTPESASKQYREVRIRRSEDGDQSVPLAMVFMQEDDSSVTGGQTLSLAAGRTLSSSTVTLEPYLAAENIAAAAAETSASAGKTATVIDIVPDASMYNTDGSAKLGDLVPSAKTDSTEPHFVTPQKTTEISDDSIVLQATGVSAADFESTAPALPRVSWIGGLPAGTDKTKRKVSRTTAAHTVVKLKPQNGTGVVMNVWVVWADIQQEQGNTEFVSVPNPNGVEAWRVIPAVGTQKRFVFTIEPKSITDLNTDIPDLKGAASSQHPPPGSSKPFFGDAQKMGDHAGYKWDVSRQVKITVTNADLISKAELMKLWPPAVCAGQPVAAATIPVPFPALDYEGNDDPKFDTGTDEDNDPYHPASSIGDLRHAAGEITSTDRPSVPALDAWVTKSGMKLEFEFQFREFARVQIWDGKRSQGQGQFWFRISEFGDGEWQHHAKFESGFNFWKNNGSTP